MNLDSDISMIRKIGQFIFNFIKIFFDDLYFGVNCEIIIVEDNSSRIEIYDKYKIFYLFIGNNKYIFSVKIMYIEKMYFVFIGNSISKFFGSMYKNKIMNDRNFYMMLVIF